MYLLFGKRLFDIFSASAGIVVLSPVFLITMILIKLTSPGPVFFLQKRVGKDFEIFKIFKFRTMVADAEKLGPCSTSSNDSRITPLGRKLRKYKIDELPQLFNVMLGDMSIVGPRPTVSKYVEAKREEYAKALSVKPGITDYVALEFINEEQMLDQYDDKEAAYIEYILPEKLVLFNKYVDSVSFVTDLSIIMRTIAKIIR